MADDNWQLEAVHEQFNVFESIKKPFEIIKSTECNRLILEVKKILLNHCKIRRFDNPLKSVSEIAVELLKYGNEEEIKLSFVVVVTNINLNGNLSKIPIFVIISSGQKTYLDMNLTLFASWEAFLANNNLPPCQYCFPVEGQYMVGRKLKVNFTTSPAALKKNETEYLVSIPSDNRIIKSSFVSSIINSIVSATKCAGSFFFKIAPIIWKNTVIICKKIEPLLQIACVFTKKISKFAGYIVELVSLCQAIRNRKISAAQGLNKLGQLLLVMHKEFEGDIAEVFIRVKAVMSKLYRFIEKELFPFFEQASECIKHHFMAVTYKVDEEIYLVESEAEEIIEASLKNNYTSEITRAANTMHSESESGSAYRIFHNAKNNGAVNCIEKKRKENILNPKTAAILETCKYLTVEQSQGTLQDVMNYFEPLSLIIKEEFIDKIKTYSEMLRAAKVGAGHEIDIKKFNNSLGIHGDVKNYFWKKAVFSILEPRLAYRVEAKKASLDGKKNILILPVCEVNNENPNGAYWLVGVNGRGFFSEKDLIKDLKKQFEFNEIHRICKDVSTILIQSEEFMFAVKQQLNSENTSEGFMVVSKRCKKL